MACNLPKPKRGLSGDSAFGRCPGLVIPSMNGDRKELFELKEYPLEFLAMMNDLRQSSTLCDVTIKVEHNGSKRKFTAHKLVLAASSPYFKAMFTGGCREKNSSEVSMSYIHPEVFSTILEFVYTSKIQISERCVLHVMSGASMLQMNHVVKICCDFLETQLEPSNCIGLASFACDLGCMEFKHKVEKYICQNFDEVSKHEEFKMLSVCQISKVVGNDELYVADESQVYDAVTRWVRHDLHSRQQYLTMLIAAVRCHSLTPSFIAMQLEKCPMIKKPEMKNCRKHLAKVLQDLTVHNPAVNCKPRQPDIPQAIYVVGGYLRNSLTTAECFLPETCQWIGLRDLPAPRSGSSACVIQGLVYVIGGRNNTVDSSTDIATCERYNPMTNQWDRCKPMWFSRNRVGIGVIDNEMYAVGGSRGSEHQSTVEKYDPPRDTWTMMCPMRTARIGVGCAVINRMLYAVGGFDGRVRLSSVEQYHPENNEWRFVQGMLTSRSGAGVVGFDNFIYAIGGYDGSEQLNTVERYDVSENKWYMVARMRHRRSALTVCVYNRKIYAIGGYDGVEFLSSVECYDPERNEWREVSHMSTGRSGCASIVGYRPCVPINNIVVNSNTNNNNN